MNRTEITAVLEQGQAEVFAALNALPPEQLEKGLKPSRADESIVWTAKDHFSHLIGIEKVFNGLIKTVLSGSPNPLAAKADDPPKTKDEVMAPIHSMNDKWILTTREKSLPELIDLAKNVRSQTLALLADTTDEQLGQVITGFPWGDSPVAHLFVLHAKHGSQHLAFIRDGLAA
jgi:DinB superfamily